MRIPIIDLGRQYRSMQAELDQAVREVLASGVYILGPRVAEFEAALAARTGTKFAAGVNSGTDALEMALRACGIGPGDEVIVPALTFMSTALAVTAVGGTPVLADIEPVTYGLDAEDAAARITPRTKAIIPVHLYGQVCDIDSLLRLARRHRLTVIEDCAQAIGAAARGQAAGSFGAAGCFSFYPTKNLGAAGDGGAVVASDKAVAKALALVRNYGTEDKLTYQGFGRNSRLDELQAAILLVKLKHLDRWIDARRERAGWYREAVAAAGLDGVVLPAERPGRRHVYHLFVVRVPKRDRILAGLQRQGIQAMAHYPHPLHQHSIYASQRSGQAPLPQAERICSEVLSLPVHPDVTRAQVDEVVSALKRLLTGSRKRATAGRAA